MTECIPTIPGQPDWIVKEIHTSNLRGGWYLKGENLNYPADHPQRGFFWRHLKAANFLGNPRYDLSAAVGQDSRARVLLAMRAGAR